MDIYTLDENFLRRDVVDEFHSVIWTERYTKHGDVNLVVPVNQKNVSMLPEKTFLGLRGTREVMQIENALIEDNKLKLTGPSITKFLDERVIRYTASHADRYYNNSFAPEVMMITLVNDMCIQGLAPGVDGARQIIPGLDAALFEGSDFSPAVQFAVPYGPLYAALEQIAETYKVGHQLYLDHATPTVYYLLYRAYFGKDRTSGQSENDIVRFSPNVDSLTDLKELRSIAGYKNVAYAFAPSNPVPGVTQSGVAYADNEAATAMGFDRRVLMVFADDLTTDKVGGSASVLLQILNQRAKDGLANNNYTRVVDGEVVPQAQYQYGTHYGMGDIVELQSLGGTLQKARVTEYIRTQDATGERAYPTISVID